MGDARVRVVIEREVATIVLNRPEKLNALDMGMIDALEDAALAIDGDSKLRVAMITGAGPKAFCAGGDIGAWPQLPSEEFALNWVRRGHRAFDALARMRQPLIAVLNGNALGGGLELAACADFRVAEAHIKIGLPETSIGIIPGWSGTQRLVRRFGSQAVRLLAVAGEVVTAEQALGLGLVDHVVPSGQAAAAAFGMAEQIIARGALATALTKLMINAAEGEDREAAMEALGGGMAAASADLRAKITAFQTRKK